MQSIVDTAPERFGQRSHQNANRIYVVMKLILRNNWKAKNDDIDDAVRNDRRCDGQTKQLDAGDVHCVGDGIGEFVEAPVG